MKIIRSKMAFCIILGTLVGLVATSTSKNLLCENFPSSYFSLYPNVPRTTSPGPARISNLPATFDARTRWPECPGIGAITNQLSCRGGWAVASVDSISDRICIASKGRIQAHLSSVDLMECCGEGVCAEPGRGGCKRGDPYGALKYYAENGIVTGSGYPNKTGCKPYPDNPAPESTPSIYPPVKCQQACQSNYSVPYEKDRHFGVSYGKLPDDQTAIMSEIFKNGPVVASICGGKEEGIKGDQSEVKECRLFCDLTHAVRIIGWGEKAGVGYWLVANSWGADYEDRGVFKVKRGGCLYSYCGLQKEVVWALPKLA